MPFGGVIALVVLLPNLLFLFFPPQAVPPKEEHQDSLYKTMQWVERVGQVGVMVIPFFYALPSLRGAAVDALVAMAFSLIFYYAGWMRYLLKGRRFILLYGPFLGVPLPMAIAPVLYFLSAAIFIQSWPLGAAAIVLAVGHLYISLGEYRRITVHAY